MTRNFLDSLSNRYGSDFSIELQNHLEKHATHARSFVEWGAGESTKLIAGFARRNDAALFLSIDDNAEYLAKVAKSIPPFSFLQFQHLDLEGPSYSQDDHGCNYSSYPVDMGHRFDFVLIDGRRRMECALVAARVLWPDGRALLHDWRRSRYAYVRDIFDVEEEGRQFLVLRPKPRPIEPPRRRPHEKRAIFVILQGPHANAEFAVTETYFRDYAHRVDADFKPIHADPSVPRAALKTLPLIVAHEYDRFAILDADIIVRPHAPDIFEVVPPDRLGVMVEGRRLDRRSMCEELTQLYDLETAIPAEQYFNTGVLVMSRRHIPMLEALREGPVFGHPLFEQGLINVLAHTQEIPIYDLPTSLNHLITKEIGVDFRYGAFVHVAGSGKQSFKLSKVWTEEVYGGARYLSSRPFVGRFVRLQRLLEIAAQVAGKEVRLFDADDLFCDVPGTYPELVDDMLLVSLGVSRKPQAVWGPYAAIRAGRWRVCVLAPDGRPLVDSRVMIDLCHDRGLQMLLAATSLDGHDIVVDIHEDVEDLETRLSISDGRVRFLAIRLERECDAPPETE
jgi:hypothetical protein